MAYADFADVALRYEGILDGPRTTQLLLDAETLIRSVVPALDARVADGRTDADALRLVLVRMAIRVLRNPSGVTQETTGPFGVSFSRDVAGGALFLTSDDRRLLGVAAAGYRAPVPMGLPPWRVPAV